MSESDEWAAKPVERPNDIGGHFTILDPWYDTTTTVKHGSTGTCIKSTAAGPDKQFDIKFDALTLRFDGDIEDVYRRYELRRDDPVTTVPAGAGVAP